MLESKGEKNSQSAGSEYTESRRQKRSRLLRASTRTLPQRTQVPMASCLQLRKFLRKTKQSIPTKEIPACNVRDQRVSAPEKSKKERGQTSQRGGTSWAPRPASVGIKTRTKEFQGLPISQNKKVRSHKKKTKKDPQHEETDRGGLSTRTLPD